MGTPLVVIASAPQDLHATAVAEHVVRAGGRAEIFDTSEFPRSTSMSMRFGRETRTTVRTGSGTVLDATDIAAVWWRRPQRPAVADDVTDPLHRQFALNEAHYFLNGFWRSLSCRWVNEPLADAAAAHKPYQLSIAPAAGLRIPDTLITNDAAEASEFVTRHEGRAIYKAMAGLPDAWRETRLLREDEKRWLPAVRHAPVVFQEYIEGTDLRVTVVGRRIFAGEMQSPRGRYPVDVRMDMTVPVAAVALDDETTAGIHALMARLGLVYGALDFKRDRDGRLYFLEINPAGQFLFMEELAALPISAALARLLVHGEEA